GKLKKAAEGIEEGKDFLEHVIDAQKKAEKAKDTAKDAKKSVEDVEIETKGTGKFISSADDVVFKQSSIDKAFSKHRKDFGSYPDGSKSSVELFKNDVSELINTGVRKQGKYRNVEGTHIYNEDNKQWTFINSDGTMNTAFKLSDSQYKYLIDKGVVK
ncbi:colicin D domain-containing protein, partial [Psychrobacillus sp. BL-248-WT-3]|uniref:colicin D domain-containing protein n=2 Tax=unclassified Psychrobacillus TaxID=2636677 RepID=UPI001811142A